MLHSEWFYIFSNMKKELRKLTPLRIRVSGSTWQKIKGTIYNHMVTYFVLFQMYFKITLKIQRAQKCRTTMKPKCPYYFRCQLSIYSRGSNFQQLITYPIRHVLCMHKHILVQYHKYIPFITNEGILTIYTVLSSGFFFLKKNSWNTFQRNTLRFTSFD